MSVDKIYLGTMDLGTTNGKSRIYLYRHNWDCNWYWGFGYVGNSRNHFHMESLISGDISHEVSEHFNTTWITQDQWWIIRDLFIQAYALKAAAAAYLHGGHQTGNARDYRIISQPMNKTINADLEILLDTIWELLTEWKP